VVENYDFCSWLPDLLSKIALVIVIVPSGYIPLDGTTVVLNRTHESIVVAADSLWSRADGKREAPQTFGCKISNVGHIYFTASTSDIDAVLLESLAREAMRTSVTIAEAAHKLSLKRDLLADHTAKYFSQESIDRVWSNGKGAADVVFFGIEHGEPRLILINFLQVGHSRAKLKFHTKEHLCPIECVNNRPIVLGIHEHIDKAIEKNPHITTGATQAALRKLVKLEADAAPEAVGGPIDVLTLDGKGLHWEGTEGGMCSPDETKPPREAQTLSQTLGQR
jgi:hypothetical protein